MLGYAATTDVRNVPIVVADADRSTASRELIARFERVAGTSRSLDVVTTRDESIPTSRAARAWMAVAIPAGYGERHRRGAAADAAGDRRWQRRELGWRGARLRGEPDRRLRAGAGGRRGDRKRGDRAGASGIEPRSARLVQPAPRKPRLHGPRRARAAAARGHDEPVVDGDRAGERAGHARTAERHAAPAVGADCRQAAALRAGRHHRRRARAGGGGPVVRGAAARQRAAAVRADARLPADHARTRPVRLDDLFHAAAGDDDHDVLLPDADGLSVGVHLSDREHAGGDSAAHLPDSAALLPGDPAVDFPEGRRPGDASGRRRSRCWLGSRAS